MSQVNIYDTANQLERDIRELPAYKALQDAYAKIKENETSYELFEKFRQTSAELQQKAMSGEQPSEEEIQELQSMSQEISADENINQLMQAEQQMSQVFDDINNIITKPLSEIYQ
ncbi:YlbF family regulator [Aerococcaceae bacterium DSM 111020]|nr:YlbF family regulator [Aerococcaceae bacterium DSM 111020]